MKYLLAIFYALVFLLSFPPYALWPLSFVAFALVAHLVLRAKSPKEAVLIFFLYNFFINVFGFYWLGVTLLEFGEMSLWAAIPVLALIFVLFSLPSVLYVYLYQQVKRRITNLGFLYFSLFLFFVLWDALDIRLFPWSPPMALGMNRYFLSSVYYLGTWGWRLLFFGLCTASVAVAVQKRPLSQKVIFVLLPYVIVLGLTQALGLHAERSLRAQYTGSQPIALLQGNIGNYQKKLAKLKVLPTVQNVLSIHRDLLEQIPIHYRNEQKKEVWVFWPETSFPEFPLNEAEGDYILKDWSRLVRGLNVVGTYQTMQTKFAGQDIALDYNIVALYHEKKGYVSHYQKMIRIPFGEYIPGDEWFPKLYDLLPAVNHFGFGSEAKVLAHPDENGPVFIPLICYEALYPDHVSQMVQSAEQSYPGRPLIFVNPANDSWYGPTAEIFQHALLARWNAVRFGIPLVRPTNTGLSEVVAPWGEILAEGPRDESFVIFSSLPVKKTQMR